MALHTIDSLKSLVGKTVLLRIDSDVDISGSRIVDDTRLAASLDTVKLILEKGGSINIIGHLGRPKGADDKFSLALVAKWFAQKLKGDFQEIKIGRLKAWKVTDRVNLIENVRFFPEEEKNGEEFARELSLLGDIFVNDAFAVSHRAHASIVGVTKFIPSYAGLHLQKEVEVLSKIIRDPKRPLAVLIGGAKIETKLPLVEAMHRVADYVLVGGQIADQDRILIKVQHEKIIGKKSAVLVSEANPDNTDITPKSVENFEQILGMAQTIVWNGPVGVTNDPTAKTAEGTKRLGEFIVKTNAYKVVGGGDTLAFLKEVGLISKFDFVSTGGGAMLEFLSGKKLPGIEAIEH